MTAASTPQTNRPVVELLPAQASEASHATTWLGRALAIGGALLSVIYLSNLGFGIGELLPDNIPGAGNIDEVLFTMLLLYCLRQLGIDLGQLLGRTAPRKN